MRLFSCPRCGTPVSRADDGECSCGTRIPMHIVDQILALTEPIQEPLALPPSTSELQLSHHPPA